MVTSNMEYGIPIESRSVSNLCDKISDTTGGGRAIFLLRTKHIQKERQVKINGVPLPKETEKKRKYARSIR